MENLLKITLSISLIGILLLLFLAEILEPQVITIDKITNKDINKKVKVRGQVFKISNKETFQILSVQDSTGKIDVLANSNLSNSMINQNITVLGRIKEYNQYLQISADKILIN